jgi:hypothetical protein
MILLSFVLFLALVVAWLAAPSGEKKIEAPSTALKLSESPAD